MLDRNNQRLGAEIKRLTEKQLNLKLFGEKIEKDLHLARMEIKSIKSKFNMIDYVFLA